MDGKRAYELARKGSDVELKSNRVTIHEIEVLDFALPVLKIRVVCSKGTYIRSLARDIGRSLDSGAHLTALQRTRSGDYDIKNAISIDFWYQYMLSLQAEKRKVDS